MLANRPSSFIDLLRALTVIKSLIHQEGYDHEWETEEMMPTLDSSTLALPNDVP